MLIWGLNLLESGFVLTFLVINGWTYTVENIYKRTVKWFIFDDSETMRHTSSLWVIKIKWVGSIFKPWKMIIFEYGIKSCDFYATIFMSFYRHWPNWRGVPSEQHSFVNGSNGVDRQHFLIFPCPSSGWYGYRLGNWPQQESSGSGLVSTSSLVEPIFKRMFGFWNSWARTNGGVFF